MSTSDRFVARASSGSSPAAIQARAWSGSNSGHTRTVGTPKRRSSVSPTHPGGDALGNGHRQLLDRSAGVSVEVVAVGSLERRPAREGHHTVLDGEEIGVGRPGRAREATDQHDRCDRVGATVGRDPGEGRCRRVTDDHGPLHVRRRRAAPRRSGRRAWHSPIRRRPPATAPTRPRGRTAPTRSRRRPRRRPGARGRR